jgi:FAD synthase
MRVVRDLALVQPSSDTLVAVGVFDGVHRGHQRLISCMVEAAHARGNLAVVYTFDPHPLTALGRQPPPLLTTVEERADVMASLGLDVLLVPPFTAATVRIRAAGFARDLVQHLRMVELWAGPEFALGYHREGTVARLQQLGLELGFSMRIVEPLVCEGAWVSSSRVREALETGDVAWAAGRLVPAPGIYACLAHIAGLAPCAALAWIRRVEAGQPVVEIYALMAGFSPQKTALALDFLAYLRERWELDDETVLAGQVHHDAEQAQALAVATSAIAVENCTLPGG